MVEFALLNTKIYLDEYILSGDANSGRIIATPNPVDVTKFGDTWKRRISGVIDGELAVGGFWNADGSNEEPDKLLFDNLGLADKIITICPEDLADGNVAFTTKGMEGEYEWGGGHGEAITFSLTGRVHSIPIVRSKVMASGAKTTSADGTAYQEGLLGSGQTLYAALHVLAVSGGSPTLDLKIQSDDNSGMTSAIDRITFTQFTAVGSELLTLAGPVANDDWWRATWTITGSTPSFTVAVTMGIM